MEQRLPAEPLVLKSPRAAGTCGGTWWRAFPGPGNGEKGNRTRPGDKPLFWNATGTTLAPQATKAWSISDDGKRTTLFPRKDMKWPDGMPFTADDFVFWFDDTQDLLDR